MSDINWKGVGKKVGDLGLTLLGGVLGGPAGASVGGMISNALGLKEDSTPDQVLETLIADPNKVLELRKFEMEHKIELEKLKLAESQQYILDTQNARTREIDITKSIGKRDINLYVLAWIIVTGFFLLCGLLAYHTIPEGSSQVVFMLYGALASGFGSVLNYFFGSSASSDLKTKLMSNNVK